MSKTVAELLVDTLARIGVGQVFGVVGDALNPFTDAIGRDDRIEWIGVRHEEGAALAAAGQAKLSGRLGVCCGTTGPGVLWLPRMSTFSSTGVPSHIARQTRDSVATSATSRSRAVEY